MLAQVARGVCEVTYQKACYTCKKADAWAGVCKDSGKPVGKYECCEGWQPKMCEWVFTMLQRPEPKELVLIPGCILAEYNAERDVFGVNDLPADKVRCWMRTEDTE